MNTEHEVLQPPGSANSSTSSKNTPEVSSCPSSTTTGPAGPSGTTMRSPLLIDGVEEGLRSARVPFVHEWRGSSGVFVASYPAFLHGLLSQVLRQCSVCVSCSRVGARNTRSSKQTPAASCCLAVVDSRAAGAPVNAAGSGGRVLSTTRVSLLPDHHPQEKFEAEVSAINSTIVELTRRRGGRTTPPLQPPLWQPPHPHPPPSGPPSAWPPIVP